MAPEPYDPTRNCDDPARDREANFTAPYAVPIASGLQLVIFDSAHAGNAPLDPGKPDDAHTRDVYLAQARQVGTLAAGTDTWFVSHHPVLAYAPANAGQPPYPGNPALQQALDAVNGTAYFPASVRFALAGHVHLFQALSFASGHPPSIVAGQGGDNMDADLPAQIANPPAPGASVAHLLHARRFGFLVLDRRDDRTDAWNVTVNDADGKPWATCALGPGRALACQPAN
jgi:hypothetical protein